MKPGVVRLYRAERRNFLRKKIGFLAHVCCISLYRALYRDFLRKSVLKKNRDPYIYYSIFGISSENQVKFRCDCEYVEPDLSKNRYIGDFLANRQPRQRKIVQKALFLRFLCFFLARACVCAKKAVPLHCISKEGASVLRYTDKSKSRQGAKVQAVAVLSRCLFGRGGAFFRPLWCAAYLVAFRSLSPFFSLPVRAAVCGGRVPSSLLAYLGRLGVVYLYKMKKNKVPKRAQVNKIQTTKIYLSCRN